MAGAPILEKHDYDGRPGSGFCLTNGPIPWSKPVLNPPLNPGLASVSFFQSLPHAVPNRSVLIPHILSRVSRKTIDLDFWPPLPPLRANSWQNPWSRMGSKTGKTAKIGPLGGPFSKTIRSYEMFSTALEPALIVLFINETGYSRQFMPFRINWFFEHFFNFFNTVLGFRLMNAIPMSELETSVN